MKKMKIKRAIVVMALLLNAMLVAAEEWHVVEIDSVEYYSAKCGFEKYYCDLGDIKGCILLLGKVEKL